MTSTKIFSVNKTSILVVAVFTMAITLGLGSISSSMALADFINCNTQDDGNSNDDQVNTVKTCHEEVNKGTSDSNDNTSDSKDSSDASSNHEADTPHNIANFAPAVASSDDNIIKPINLNKGFDSDEPLQTNNVKHVSSNDDGNDKIKSKKTVEDSMPSSFNKKFDKNTSMSDLYDSFNLPYTALYKN